MCSVPRNEGRKKTPPNRSIEKTERSNRENLNNER